ncbi:MAG: toll/interleukin-1 receptor domain-containing protein [Anaerolineae bacterium]|mgnify:CR=1 FL=1|jgi:hypothetical protein|nr:toll/interleukin-1 receptor domain-containing protein [Anaerolineae bacterium]MBT7072737.1 toll/interleukin-1 receptor domain-containing protein [Anaerolineae bacterium]MBT7324652.1 toll/interleukin-1 receptor domain-containing protein [Anaerolineae bacterium]
MGHIFISYSHKDKKYVEKLEKKLIDEGFDVWIDHRIDYGDKWPEEIEKAIDICDAYVVVMSKNAAESQWVGRERIHAEKRRKPFFPLLLKGENWFSLGDIQYVDVKAGAMPPERFYKRLASVIDRKEKDRLIAFPIKGEAVFHKKPLGDKNNSKLRRFNLVFDYGPVGIGPVHQHYDFLWKFQLDIGKPFKIQDGIVIIRIKDHTAHRLAEGNVDSSPENSNRAISRLTFHVSERLKNNLSLPSPELKQDLTPSSHDIETLMGIDPDRVQFGEWVSCSS